MINTHTYKIKNFDLKVSQEGIGFLTLVIGSHTYYPRVFSDSLKAKLCMYFLDHRGFTKDNSAQTSNDFNLSDIIQDIEELRQRLNFKKFILIGHSIHAFMALEYAKIYPQHISHLVLIASSQIVG
jgi:proline iminopeptidase